MTDAAIQSLGSRTAGSHVWAHFSELNHDDSLTMVRGEGPWLYDSNGKRYYDALSALYCVNVGHGRAEIAEAMASQARELAFFPLWGDNLTEPAIALADRLADLAPPSLNRVFFTSGGAESVDAAWKLTRQYHYLRGRKEKTKIVARNGAYHGTTLGALSVTGVPSIKEPFGPLIPGAVHGPRVDLYRTEEPPLEAALAAADAIEALVEGEGPETVGAIIVEPVQNSGGCLVAPPEYFARLRQICDAHDLLLISDETICAFGRLGTYFGCQAFDYLPDVLTTAKGLTSGYAPMGAMLIADRIAEPFLEPGVGFSHGITFGGHPVAAAAAVANLEIFEREDLCTRATAIGREFRQELEGLRELPIVGDVRGFGLFHAIELVADQETKAPLDSAQSVALGKFVPGRLIELGIISRSLHRGAPILQFAPTLIAEPDHLHDVVQMVRGVLLECQDML